jgi:hypothetical protein
MLVFPSDLEEVEEIRGGGVDCDCVLMAGGSWVWKLSYFEL